MTQCGHIPGNGNVREDVCCETEIEFINIIQIIVVGERVRPVVNNSRPAENRSAGRESF
jgi:hypothetical protein